MEGSPQYGQLAVGVTPLIVWLQHGVHGDMPGPVQITGLDQLLQQTQLDLQESLLLPAVVECARQVPIVGTFRDSYRRVDH
jgi:hypothetical protein